MNPSTVKNAFPSEGSPPPYSPWAYWQQSAPEDEIRLFDVIVVLWRGKWRIFACVLLGIFLSYGVTRLQSSKYLAKVTMMPITSNSSSGGVLGGLASQISSIPLVGGSLGGLGDKLGGGKAKELTNILKSHTLTERMINRFDLMKVLFASQWNASKNQFEAKFLKPVPVMEDAVRMFRKKVALVEIDKKSDFIKIEVEMKDPTLAAKIANGMVVELQDFIRNNALTTAKRNRIFIEEQLVKNRIKLLEAGKELNQFYAQNKISSVVPELNVQVGSYELLPKSFEDFREELDQLYRTQEKTKKKIESPVVSGVPGQVYLEYLTLNRELLNAAHSLLTQQFEMAKIDEAKEDLAFQVIDKAEVPMRSNSPKLLVNLLIGILAGAILGVSLAFIAELLRKQRSPASTRA